MTEYSGTTNGRMPLAFNIMKLITNFPMSTPKPVRIDPRLTFPFHEPNNEQVMLRTGTLYNKKYGNEDDEPDALEFMKTPDNGVRVTFLGEEGKHLVSAEISVADATAMRDVFDELADFRQNLKRYIGTKVVSATKMRAHNYEKAHITKSDHPVNVLGSPDQYIYAVHYPSEDDDRGYNPWTSADHFESVARRINPEEGNMLELGEPVNQDWYFQTKVVRAIPMTSKDYKILVQGNKAATKDHFWQNGYFVQYDNGHESWSPKDKFEQAYQEA